MIYKFGEHTLDTDQLELRRATHVVPVEPQVLDLLHYLIRNRERVVSRDDLITHVWNGRIVSDSALTSRITAVRQAVGDNGKEQRLIRTFSRKGLRFVGEVREQLSAERPAAHCDSDTPAEHNTARSRSPERRQVTILVCDLIGGVGLSKHVDPEDLRDVLAACHRRVKATAERFEGFIAEYRAGRVLIYFGYPAAHEYDAERAVRAALAIIAAIAELKFDCIERLQPRIGIATGVVVIGDIVADVAAGQHAVAGDTPYAASELLALAQPGHLVVCATTHHLLGSLFAYEDVLTSPSRGEKTPFHAYRVLRERRITSRFDALRSAGTRLVGRDEELALLLRRWRQAKAGEGRVVLVWGEPGIGKSRLMAGLQDALQRENRATLWFWCWPHRSETAFHPVITYIETAANIDTSDSNEIKLEKLNRMFAPSSQEAIQDALLFADLLGISIGDRTPALSISSQRRKELLLERFIAHLVGLASRRPTLIVLEDAHWIDPTTRELFDIVVERVVQLPILLVMTYRPEFSPPWLGQAHVAAVTLNRLGWRESAIIIKEVAAGRPLARDLLEQIATRSDGVPLFIEEMTKSVLEELPIDASGQLPSLSIPATLQASLVARLDRVPAARGVAQVAAAIGREFTYATLKAVVARADRELEHLLHELVASELVHQRGTPPHATYFFKHVLVQDAAYQTLLKDERIKTHARVAEVLEHEFPETAQRSPEILAYHCEQGARWEKAIDYWLAATRMALDRSAGAEAQAQAEKGMALLPKIKDNSSRRQLEGRLYAALGNTFAMTKGFASIEVTKALSRARKLLDEKIHPFEALSALGGLFNYHLMRSESPAGLRLARPLLVRWPDGPARAFLHLLVGAAQLHMGDFRKSKSQLERSLALYDEETCRSLAFVAGYHMCSFALIWLGLVRLYTGSIGEAKETIAAAVRDARSRAHPFTLTSALLALARFCIHLRDLEGARAAAEEGLEIAIEQRSPYHVSRANILRAVNFIEGQQPLEGIALMESALVAHRQTGANYQSSFNLSYLALAHAQIGDFPKALRIAAQANQEVERTGEHWWKAEAHRIQGELVLRASTSQRNEAERCLHEALECARRQEATIWELRAAKSLAMLWLRNGRKSQSRELLMPLCEAFSAAPEFPDLKDARALSDAL